MGDKAKKEKDKKDKDKKKDKKKDKDKKKSKEDDEDILDEEVIAAWHTGPSPSANSYPGVTKEASVAVKGKAAVFVQWLAEAESDDDDEEESD